MTCVACGSCQGQIGSGPDAAQTSDDGGQSTPDAGQRKADAAAADSGSIAPDASSTPDSGVTLSSDGGVFDPNRITTWNPGILADTQLGLALGPDGLRVDGSGPFGYGDSLLRPDRENPPVAHQDGRVIDRRIGRGWVRPRNPVRR
jgi:hypothetical protein